MQDSPNKFPYENSVNRLERYKFNDDLFLGDHFSAFRQKVNSDQYNRDYAALKYVTGNFAGLISKVCADMLFSEKIKIKVEDGDQDFIDALIFQNKLDTQFYESALANSRHGDAVFKIRMGKINPGDSESTVIIEDITPSIYFPAVDGSNMRQEPSEKELAWVVTVGKQEYLRKEIHTPGLITNELWKLNNGKIETQVDLSLIPGGDQIPETEETGVNSSLVIHVPNWRDGSTYFGYDDYSDLTSLFYALNNRMTKTENILDKHSDPILALPQGVLDEDGNVQKSAFHMFEIPDGGTGTPSKPEYIVWNASLESSFNQVEKITEFMYMFSETSPDAFGMGKGQADSGRALKLRLMRTIAKVARKRLYYDTAIKQVIHTAQEFAKANGIGVLDQKKGTYTLKLKRDVVVPEIEWQDGLPVDDTEAIENEQTRINSGTTSTKDAIMRLDRVDEDTAEEKVREIKEETSVELPSSNPVKLDTKSEEDNPDGGE